MSRTSTEQFSSASAGFDLLFSNELSEAYKLFEDDPASPFHLVGVGVCAFLEAALGLESVKISEASRLLTIASKKTSMALDKSKEKEQSRFPPGTDMEILNADTVVLLGIASALSESYMGYLQCMYALNSAHSKFTKLYKTVFPAGIDYLAAAIETPSASGTSTPVRHPVKSMPSSSSLFGRWGSGGVTVHQPIIPEGPIDEMIVAGTAFGYGLFNLVFSLLPKRIQSLVGLFGYKHDRKLALRALAVSADGKDVHSVFAGLVLMTYYGIILLLTGYQADEAHIIRRYRAVVDNISSRYPTGSLWVLNRAKLLRMSGDPDGAIEVLQEGLKVQVDKAFAQADSLLVFELAWTYFGQRRYEDSAEMWERMATSNSWSHATYYYLAAGCYISVRNVEKAQELLDKLPGLLDKRKVGGKEPPMEVLIKKRLDFYKEKQVRRGGDVTKYAECIRISPAEEMSIFWNTHTRIPKDVAGKHIEELVVLTPHIGSTSAEGEVDLDTPDELALRLLLLGIVNRTTGQWEESRKLLDAAAKMTLKSSSWIPGVSIFERVVLDLKEMDSEKHRPKDAWEKLLKESQHRLDHAMTLSPNSVDLSSRLDSRIAMLKDEIEQKKEMLRLV